MKDSLTTPLGGCADTTLGSVLVTDDDADLLRVICRELRNRNYECVSEDNVSASLKTLSEREFDVALLDLEMPEVDGFQMLATLQQRHADTIPIVLTGTGDISRAVKAMKLGAFDFLEKPCNPHLLAKVIHRAVAYRRATRHAEHMAAVAEQWQATFDASPDHLLVTDLLGRIVRCNQAMAAHAEGILGGLSGHDAHAALCSGSHGAEECPFRPPKNGESLSIPEQGLWEGFFNIRASQLGDKEGKPVGWLFVARDITESRKTEAALRASEEKFRQMVNSMAIGVLLVDRDMHILETNHQMRDWWPELAQHSESELPLCHALFPAVGCTAPCKGCPVTETLRDGEVHENVVSMARQDGAHSLRIIASPIHDREGRVTAAIATYGDITEKLRIARELSQAQRLEAVGRLAAGIAHEINTPAQYVGDNIEFLQLASGRMIGLANLLLKLSGATSTDPETAVLLNEAKGMAADGELEYFIHQIPRALEQSVEGLERISSIVRAMKEFSHPGAAKKTLADLNQCLHSTITVSRNEWKYVADLKTDLDSGLPLVSCLPGELNQVFLNLIVNAAHAISDAVGEGSGSRGGIVVTTRRLGPWAEIRISDSGTGIPEEIRERIFDPFFTTKEVGRGTGQGLAIARSVVVDKHGGTIDFETETGTGTTFIVRLPVDA